MLFLPPRPGTADCAHGDRSFVPGAHREAGRGRGRGGEGPRVSRLVLFDIDNTLLWSGGAGGLAMSRAFHDLFGIEDGFKAIEFSGRTDRYILAEGLRQHGINGDYADRQDRFLGRYGNHLPQTLSEAPGGLMPRVPAPLA